MDLELKENSYPVDDRGAPDLSYYRDSPAYYADMHRQFREATSKRGHDAGLEFGRRVHSCWGLVAQGQASIPYVLEMLRSDHGDAREDAAGVLAAIGKDPEVERALIQQLRVEDGIVARDGIILALGAMRSRPAIPVLAALIRDETTDGDTRWTVMESLARIARRRFDKQPDPIAAAIAWLDR